ncbi:MAG: vitamin B12 dependent-methionine synthase activation domain-containing protein [Candidatus Eisenbacteria bacterium]
MRKTLHFPPSLLLPDRRGVFESQGIPRDADSPGRVAELHREAERLFLRHAKPAGVFMETAGEEFLVLFRGEGKNEPDTPLEKIVPRARRLALFAATLGGGISAAIAGLFEENEPALGSMLDSVASAAADRAAAHMEERYHRYLAAEGDAGPGTETLAYSPGYCGWDISGQRKLFELLKPEEIGVALGASFLMSPIKSVSGVLVSGPAEIHRFAPDYPFCAGCRAAACRARATQ